MGVDDLTAIVLDLGLVLAIPGRLPALLTIAIVMAPHSAAPAVLNAVDISRPHLSSAICQHGVSGGHAEQRRLAGAECHGEHRRQFVVDSEAARVFTDERHAHVLRETHRHEVARMLDADTQRRRTVELPAVILRPPNIETGTLLDRDRRIEHDTRRLVAIVERGGIDERLERRSRLATRLSGTIELAQREREAADAREHAARVRIHDDDAATDLGNLHKRPHALRLVMVFRRNVDHVADVQHVARARLLARLAVRPPDLLVRNLDSLAVGNKAAVLLARRAQSDRCLLPLDLEHDAKTPRLNVAREFNGAERRAPIAGDGNFLDGPAPTLLAIEGNQSLDERAPGKHLIARRQRRANGEAALIELLVTELRDQRAPNLFGKIIRRVRLHAERADVDDQRLRRSCFGFLLGDVAILGHQPQDGIAASDSFLLPAEGMVVVRPLGQRR